MERLGQHEEGADPVATEVTQRAYGVFDTETGQWWAMYAYGTVSAAKNSWNAAGGRYRYETSEGRRILIKNPTFNDQTRYIVRPIRFTALDIE
jgi:hypothetical protein